MFANNSNKVIFLKLIMFSSLYTQLILYWFSPDPRPQLIAWYPTRSPALSLSRGLERDRGVDETGHQIAIFGRIGSRPFTAAEMKQLYMVNGRPFFVTDRVKNEDFVPARREAASLRALVSFISGQMDRRMFLS